MKQSAAILALCGSLALGACSFNAPASDDSASSSSASSESVIEDVSYTGVINELGVSIYMQGTHKLTLENGQFLILESSTLDLNNYLGRSVRVTGDVQPTVEEGGMIMRVETVSTMEQSSEESSESSDTADSSSESSIASATSSKEAATNIASSRAAASVAAASSASTDASDAKAQAMAKANMGTANWTQQYCSKQMGFCAPIHKNWWFTSFGATSTYLAHVEVSSEELEVLGDGPLSINVVSGSISNDGQVVTQGSETVGYRTWSNDRHIEVRAPSILAEAVRYITQNIAAAPVQ